jgi:histidinol phosphatase-like enzyme
LRPGPRPAVFIDRDGTLIEERDYLADPGDLALVPGSVDALLALREAG